MTNTDKQIVYSLGLRKGELVRVRSRDEIRGLENSESYTVCGNAFTAPGDGFLRRVFEKSVSLRNTSAIQLFN